MGIGICIRRIYVAGNIVCLGFFGKNKRNAQAHCSCGRYCNARRFDGQNLCYVAALKKAAKLLRAGAQKLCIDLLVEETADLQHIIFTDNTVGQNTLFQKLHFISPSKS